jgi:outer membrane protein assembly factor BamB
MSAIEVIVRPKPEPSHGSAFEPLNGLLDVIVDGVNLTARLGEGRALSLLAELGEGVVALSRGKRDRLTLPFYSGSEAWEIGLEADGPAVLVSVYRTGPEPEVVAHERSIDLIELRAALARALDSSTDSVLPASQRRALDAAREGLRTPWPSYGRRSLERRRLELGTPRNEALSLHAFASFRLTSEPPPERRRSAPELERADLHALLVRGPLSVRAGRAELSLGEPYLFLFAERLLSVADEVLGAWRAERPVFRRADIGGIRLSVRRGPGERALAVSFARAGGASRPGGNATLPSVEPRTFALAAARFAASLVEAFVKTDPRQRANLRLQALLREAQRIDGDLKASASDDSLTNPEPDTYRNFGLPRGAAELSGKWTHGGKMRFSPRWVAAVPGIDLQATFSCGERLVVGSSRETACLDRASGEVLWRAAWPRSSSVATPLGIVRLGQNGDVALHDLERGEARFSTHLRPRAAGGAVGAVVNAPGLPRLLALAEGDRSVTALDLVSGDVRWRYTAPRVTTFRLRRAGRLLLVAGGDSALLALDVSSGEVVWRVRDRLPFTGDVCVDRDSAFATAGGPIGPAKLFHVDLWTGEVRWSREIEERPATGLAPFATQATVLVPTRDRRGSGLTAFSRDGGELAFEHAPGLMAPTTAWLGVDDVAFGNSAAGTLLALDASSGTTRYSRVFPRHVDADQPRRLEPVLRSGALFVPQHQVHVFRPRDGEHIGTLPSDLIPDLLRVDDQCNVYIAEESGHIAAFGVMPRLSLVR